MRARLAPLALFALIATVLVGGWWLIHEREQEVLQTRLDVTARQVAARLEALLSRQVERMTLLAERAEADGKVEEERFRALSRRHQERYPGFQALNWVDADGIIRWVEPEKSNRPALGFDLRTHPTASGAFRQAQHEGIGVTPPLELLQGGWGFAAYIRVGAVGRTLGYLNGVFRLPALLERCLDGPQDRELAYMLHADGNIFGVLGSTPAMAGRLPAAEYPVHVHGRALTLSVLVPPHLSAARATWADEAVLFAGLLLAGFLAYMVRVARERQTSAEVAARRFQVLIDNSPDAIVVIDPGTGLFLNGNNRAHDLFGLDSGGFSAYGPVTMSPELQPDGRSSREAFARYLRQALTEQAQAFEWLFTDAGGETVPADVHLVRLPGDSGDLVRGSILDVRERRDLEDRLRRSQALEAMGQLAGGVAHDFNNILTAVLGSCELLARRVRGDARSEELVGTAIASTERAGDLTRQLLAFSRHAALKLESVDLTAVVRDVQPMLSRVMGERVRIRTEFGTGPVWVRGDTAQIELVILNLTVNARDALPDGGVITISVSEGEENACLAVHDEGEGISEENLERIFQPFFTTKKPGVGTGIGLATVKRIVEQFEGRIEVTSDPGQGTTFEVILRTAVAKPGQEQPARSRDMTRGAGIVVLVEDHDEVREMAGEVLEKAGYRVLSACDAEEALKMVSDRGDPVDLLITDVVLPGMDGKALAERMRQTRPGMATLFVSGYSTVDFDVAGSSGGEAEILPKPFAPSQLTERVADILDRAAGPLP